MSDIKNTAYTQTSRVTPAPVPAPNPWKTGLAAARANLVPGLILQCVAVLILVSYFLIPQGRAFFDRVEALQLRHGWFFTIPSYLFFSAAIPLVFCFSFKHLRPPRPWWKAIAFSFVLWGLMAVSVTWLYRAQAAMFGLGVDFKTLVVKVIFDQFVFSVLYGAPLVAISHFWRDRGYDFAVLRETLGNKGWFRRLILPTLVMNWTIWIPALFVMYSLPVPLQPHIGGLVNGFWSLMCMQIASRAK